MMRSDQQITAGSCTYTGMFRLQMNRKLFEKVVLVFIYTLSENKCLV